MAISLRFLPLLLAALLPAVALTTTAIAGGEGKGVSQKVFDKHLANAVRGDRVDSAPYGAVIEGDATYNLRKALWDLEKSSDWSRYTYDQRREYTFQLLVNTHLNTGSSTLLLYMLGMDARPISRELAQISNRQLARDYGLSPSAIAWYRGNLRFLKGDVTLNYREKTMAEYR